MFLIPQSLRLWPALPKGALLGRLASLSFIKLIAGYLGGILGPLGTGWTGPVPPTGTLLNRYGMYGGRPCTGSGAGGSSCCAGSGVGIFGVVSRVGTRVR